MSKIKKLPFKEGDIVVCIETDEYSKTNKTLNEKIDTNQIYQVERCEEDRLTGFMVILKGMGTEWDYRSFNHLDGQSIGKLEIK